MESSFHTQTTLAFSTTHYALTLSLVVVDTEYISKAMKEDTPKSLSPPSNIKMEGGNMNIM